MRTKMAEVRISQHLSCGPDLFDRADADAVGLAQSPVDRPGLGRPHLGAAD
jgi:hypothetical protein